MEHGWFWRSVQAVNRSTRQRDLEEDYETRHLVCFPETSETSESSERWKRDIVSSLMGGQPIRGKGGPRGRWRQVKRGWEFY